MMYILLLRNIEPHQTSPLELALQLCCLQFHYMQQATACLLCSETNKPITRLYIDVLYVFPWSISVSHNFERDERVFNPQSQAQWHKKFKQQLLLHEDSNQQKSERKSTLGTISFPSWENGFKNEEECVGGHNFVTQKRLPDPGKNPRTEHSLECADDMEFVVVGTLELL